MRLDPSFPHIPGETPASYVSRLARINGLPAGRDLCRDLGISFTGLVEGDAVSVERICDLTGTPVDQFLREARIPKVRKSLYQLRGQSVVVSSFVSSGVRVCPACVAEDISSAQGGIPKQVATYGRTAWTVAHIRTCPVHDLIMIDLPGVPLTSKQDYASVVGPWVTRGGASTANARSRQASGFEAYLLDRLEGRPTSNWLDRLPFYAAARTCEMLGSVFAFGRARKAKLLGSDDWACAGAKGFEIFVGGPTTIADALRTLITGYDGKRATPVGPMAWFGAVYDWLEYDKSDDAYDPLRELFVRCVADNAPFNPNEKMFGAPLPYRKVHSIRSAANETGLEGVRLRKALHHAGHLRLGHEAMPDHEVIFDAVKASGLLIQISTALTIVEASSHLGIDWRRTKQLVNAGLLRTLDAGVTGGGAPFIAQAEFEAFMFSLRTGSETVQSSPDGACSLLYAVRRAQSCLVDVVELVRSGSLRWIGYLEGSSGLESVLLDIAEVRFKLRRPELAGHTRREVEQALGIPSRTVNALIQRGLLGTSVQRHPTVPRDILMVVKADFDRFRELYVRMTEVAEILGIPLRRVPSVLLARGIEPALIKAEFHATFYERADIETLRSEFDDGPLQASTGSQSGGVPVLAHHFTRPLDAHRAPLEIGVEKGPG